MKRNLIIGFIIVTCISACSSDEVEIRESEVPPVVVAAFKAKYPSAEVTKWETEKEDGKVYYEAEIKEGNKEKEIHITPDGTVTEAD